MSDHQERFRDQLVLAARRQHARQQRRRASSAALALAVLVAGVAWVGVKGGDPAAAGVLVERRGDFVLVRLVDAEHRPSVIEKAARRASLDVSVDAVPVGPSLVGRFVRAQATGPAGLSDVRRLEPDGSSFIGFSVPVGWQGSLHLDVGRPAGNRPYDVPSNALGKGEPLACRPVIGRTARELQSDDTFDGLSVRWRVLDERNIILGEEISSDRADRYKVAAVAATSKRAVIATVTPTGILPLANSDLETAVNC